MSVNSKEFDSDIDIDWEFHILNDRYVPIKKIGYGSYSVVWMCFDAQKNKLVAIKIHNVNDYISGLKEEKMLLKFKDSNNKNLMDMMDSFSQPNPYREGSHRCVVMDIMAGSVYDAMNCRKFLNGLPIKVVINVIHGTLLGLRDIHKLGFIHTDIKPENILISGILKKQRDLVNYICSPEYSNDIRAIKEKYNYTKEIEVIRCVIYNYCRFGDGVREKNDFVEFSGPCDNYSEEEASHDTDLSSVLSDDAHDEVSNVSMNYDNDVDLISDTTHESLDIDLECRINRSDISDGSDDCDCIENLDDATDYENIFDDREYLTRLADLGTCIKHKKKMSKFDIQTRYYKSPEILLCVNYNQNCDIWALGCTMYEMLTGKILFDSDINDGTIRTRRHLYDIETMIKPISSSMKKSSPVNDIYYRSDGKIKGIEKYIPNPLFNKLEYLIHDNKGEEQLVFGIIDFIYKCLEVDPLKRPNVDQCLQHPLFKHI